MGRQGGKHEEMEERKKDENKQDHGMDKKKKKIWRWMNYETEGWTRKRK
jgi:hypothetical protein